MVVWLVVGDEAIFGCIRDVKGVCGEDLCFNRK
jgi:hypothetical protein